MFRKLILITFGLALYSTEVVAGSCPMDYLKRYEDGRNSKVAEHWVISIDRNDLRILEKENSLSTYNRITKERPSDFKCTFKDQIGGFYKIGKCTNSAGFSWDPTDGTGDAYIVDSKGSYSIRSCKDCNHPIPIFVDKSGNRFIVDIGLIAPIYERIRAYYAEGWDYPVHLIKDGTTDLQMEAVVLNSFFTAGSKRYVTISRETESGLYCTYKGGVAPNI